MHGGYLTPMRGNLKLQLGFARLVINNETFYKIQNHEWIQIHKLEDAP